MFSTYRWSVWSSYYYAYYIFLNIRFCDSSMTRNEQVLSAFKVWLLYVRNVYFFSFFYWFFVNVALCTPIPLIFTSLHTHSVRLQPPYPRENKNINKQTNKHLTLVWFEASSFCNTPNTGLGTLQHSSLVSSCCPMSWKSCSLGSEASVPSCVQAVRRWFRCWGMPTWCHGSKPWW